MGEDIDLDLDVDPPTLKQDGEWTTPLILVIEFAGTRRDVRGTLTNRNLNNSFEFRLRSPIDNLRPRIPRIHIFFLSFLYVYKALTRILRRNSGPRSWEVLGGPRRS